MLITGTSGADTLDDTPESDEIRGGDGADTISSRSGSDRLYGEGGDDVIRVDGSGPSTLDGGSGDDELEYRGEDPATAVATLVGGDGDDVIDVFGARSATITAGTGSDIVSLLECGDVRVSLGAGRDSFETLFDATATAGVAVISDFEAGSVGDTLLIDQMVHRVHPTWSGPQNPFTAGYIRLVQDGADVLVQLRARSALTFTTVIRLEGVSLAELTPANLEGWPPQGGDKVGDTLTGTDDADTIIGTDGADVIDGLGGPDQLHGGAGGDIIAGGSWFDRIEGGDGDDRIDGGLDDDTLTDVAGSDRLYGGEGNDRLTIDRSHEFDRGELLSLDGGAGADIIEYVMRGRVSGSVTIGGGDGNDLVGVFGAASSRADLGTGDDRYSLAVRPGRHVVTLGDGADTFILARPPLAYPKEAGQFELFVKDFNPSADAVDVFDYLAFAFPDWSGEINPFGAGMLSLVQSGRDAVVQIDRKDGSGFVDLIRFQNTQASTLESLSLYRTDGSLPTIRFDGSPADEEVFAGVGNDVIDGGGGNDLLIGFFGDDLLRGGVGNDQLEGDQGADVLHGGDGNDILNAGYGDDRLYGEAGHDTLGVRPRDSNDIVLLDGGDGGDHLFSWEFGGGESEPRTGHAVMLGGAGADLIDARYVLNAVIDGGIGDDYVRVEAWRESHTVTLGAGRDTLFIYRDPIYENPKIQVRDFQAGDGGDRLLSSIDLLLAIDEKRLKLTDFGNATAVDVVLYDYADRPYTINLATLDGVKAADLTRANFGGDVRTATIKGSIGDDVRTGTTADDTFLPSAGADTLSGGGGDDTYGVDNVGDRLIEAFDAGRDRVEASISFTLPDHIEELYLIGTDDLSGLGNSDPNRLIGNAGANHLDGAGGADVMQGMDGDDTYVVDAPREYVVEFGNGGYDQVFAWLDFAINGQSIERLVLMGEARNGFGGLGDQTIVGNGLDNRLSGVDGNDTLIGGGGADILIGGLGSDTYVVDDRLDTLSEFAGEGDDLVVASVNFRLSSDHVERLTLTGEAKYGTGNALANVITGNDAANVLDGGAGADVMAGGRGHDRYYVDNARDRVVEASRQGDDLIVSSASFSLAGTYVERLELVGERGLSGTGNSLDNRITGADGADRLDGGSGADILIGSLGADTLTGGSGLDAYVYRAVAESTVAASDVVRGLERGDRLDLRLIDANGLQADGDQAFALVAAFSGQRAQALVTYDDAAARSALWLDLDGDRVADMRIFIDGEVNTARILW